MKTTHPFQPKKYDRSHCAVCHMAVWHTNHPPIEALPGMETVDTERQAARGIAEAEELSAQFKRPLGNVSAKAGDMERNAPLFFGHGDNPILF